VPGEESEQCGQVGLFAVGRQPQFVAGAQWCPQVASEGGQQDGVVHSSAGGDDPSRAVLVAGVGDGDGGQLGEGRQQVGVRDAADLLHPLVEVFGREVLPPGGFRGWLPVVGVGQQQVQELGVRGAGGGQGAVGVLRGAGRSPG